MSIERAAAMAAEWWADRLQQGDTQAFINALRPRIETDLASEGHVYLENDYDPRGILLDAVREIGIECRGYMFSGKGIFPDKHSLEIYHDRLEPKEGYGNWTDNIPVVAASD